MSCCQCQGIESMFDSKSAEKSLKSYKKNGPSKTTRLLVDAISKQGITDNELLDIGGGIGAIHLELFKTGIKQATVVEASKASALVSEQEAIQRGYGERVKYQGGDFTVISDKISESDIVTLDRVICCYDNMQDLVRLSASKARKLYGVVYPRDSWWVKAIVPIMNLSSKLKGSLFRVFVHPVTEVDAIIKDVGLAPIFHKTSLFWQVVIYSK